MNLARQREQIRQVEQLWAVESERLLGTLSPAAYRRALAVLLAYRPDARAKAETTEARHE